MSIRGMPGLIHSDNALMQTGALIQEGPKSITIWTGCDASFSVGTIDGVDSFQWEVSSDGGNTWAETGDKKSVLTINSVQAAMDQNHYRCRVTKDGTEEVSSSAKLTVVQAPPVNAGEDRTICGSGAQNYLTVNLSASTDASKFTWQVSNGHGELKNSETLNPVYVVNPRDVGHTVRFTFSVSAPGVDCTLSDDMVLTVLDPGAFNVDLGLNETDLLFINENAVSMGLSPTVSAVQIREDSKNTNYYDNDVLLDKTSESNFQSRALFKVNLQDLPVDKDFDRAYLVIATTQAGPLESVGKDVIELFRVNETWDPSTVTWENQPAIAGEGIHPYSLNEKEIDGIDANGDSCVYVRKIFSFNISDVVSKWYKGDYPNRGFLLKLSDEAASVEFIIDKSRYPVTHSDYVNFYVYPDNLSSVYLCRDQELTVTASPSGSGFSYSWTGPEFSSEENEIILPSHNSMKTDQNGIRTYRVKGTREGCSAYYYFNTSPTPVVTMPSSMVITGTLVPDEETSKRIAVSAYNEVGTISWGTDGQGRIDDGNKVQATYVAAEADFGNTLQMTITVNSKKETCSPEVKSVNMHVLKPLYPYAGEDVSVCKGTSVTFDQASTGKVPGVTDADLQQLLDAKASGYVTGFKWEEDGNGSFDDATKLHPTYSPPENMEDKHVVTCRLLVTDGDSFRTGYVAATVRITYELAPTVQPGEYDGVKVGESISLGKTHILNGYRREWSHNGHGTFTYNEGEVPVYTPSIEDLGNAGQHVDFTVNVWSEHECEQTTAHVYLPVLPPTEVSAGAGQSICAGAGVTLQATGGISYHWSPQTGLDDPDVANPVARPSSTTTYTVTATNTYDGVEYTATSSVVITVLPVPEANAGEDKAICPGEGTTLTANKGATGEGLSYEWYKGDELISTSKTPYVMPSGTQIYKLRVTNQNNCFSEDEVEISIIKGADISFDNLSCSGTSASVAVSGYETVSWMPAESFDCATCASTAIFNIDPDRVYTFTGTVSGCTVSKEFKVPVKPGPVITGTTRYEICPNESVTFNLTATGEGNVYKWTPAGSLSSASDLNPTASPSETTGYHLSVTNSDGCNSTADVNVKVVEMPDLDLSQTITLYKGGSIDFKISRRNASEIQWTPTEGVSNPYGFYTTLSPSKTTSYTITARNGNCEDSGTLNVEVIEENDARFSFTYPGEKVQFTVPGDADTYSWNFGDGTTFETDQKNIDHTYTKPGKYNVCLKITGKSGTYEYCTTVEVKSADTVGCE